MASPRRTVSPPVFRWFALASFLSMILIVLSGAAVRLTGSGLGCPDWPTCFKGRITSPWGIHHFIEYGNRMITALLFVVVAITFISACLRRQLEDSENPPEPGRRQRLDATIRGLDRRADIQLGAWGLH